MDFSAAAGLLTTNLNHEKKWFYSQNVFILKAQKMNIDEKRECTKQVGCCFLCIKRGHAAKQCYSKVKCFLCDKFHRIFMSLNSPPESKIDTYIPVY